MQKVHAGMYQCIVHNKLGMTHAAAWLQVRDEGENITAQDLAQSSNQMQDIAPDSLSPRKLLFTNSRYFCIHISLSLTKCHYCSVVFSVVSACGVYIYKQGRLVQ